MFADQSILVEIVFNPNWWYQTAGITFDESFYFDPAMRIRNNVIMRQLLYERFGEMGMGEADLQPRPIIGSQHVAADTRSLLEAAGSPDNIGVCCINMDYGTRDENIFAMYKVVEEYRNQ